MLRIILTYGIPFLTPIAVYLAWAWYRERYAAKHGGEVPKLEKGPWPLLLFLGAVLSLTAGVFTAWTGGSDAGSTYVPARVEDGRIVPGHLDPR